MSLISANTQVLDANGIPINRNYFTTEGCGIFAVTLARRLIAQGRKAHIYVISNPDGELFSEDHSFELTHVVVFSERHIIDVHGISPDTKTVAARIGLDEFTEHGPYRVGTFEDLFMGPNDDAPLFGCTEETLDDARRLIDATPAAYGLK